MNKQEICAAGFKTEEESKGKLSCSRSTLKRQYEGRNESGSITPTCSCGWRGRPEYAYNDWQMTNVSDQESEHLRKSIHNKPEGEE